MPHVAANIAQQGIEPLPLSSPAFNELLTNHYAAMQKIIGDAGLGGE